MTHAFEERQDDELADLVAALETAPEVEVPADFAQRVMARLPHKPQTRRVVWQQAYTFAPRYGRTAMLTALAVALLAMCVVAPQARTSFTWLALEMLLSLQTCACVGWLAFSLQRSR